MKTKYNAQTNLIAVAVCVAAICIGILFARADCGVRPDSGSDTTCNSGEASRNQANCQGFGSCTSTTVANPISCVASEWDTDSCTSTSSQVTQTTSTYSGTCAYNSSSKSCHCNNSTFVSSTTTPGTLVQGGECLIGSVRSSGGRLYAANSINSKK